MEGADPDIFSTEAYDLIDTLAHLAGSLVGEGQCQNMVWVHIVVVNQICNPVCQNSCLTGTGTCKNQERSLEMFYRFLLLGI